MAGPWRRDLPFINWVRWKYAYFMNFTKKAKVCCMILTLHEFSIIGRTILRFGIVLWCCECRYVFQYVLQRLAPFMGPCIGAKEAAHAANILVRSVLPWKLLEHIWITSVECEQGATKARTNLAKATPQKRPDTGTHETNPIYELHADGRRSALCRGSLCINCGFSDFRVGFVFVCLFVCVCVCVWVCLFSGSRINWHSEALSHHTDTISTHWWDKFDVLCWFWEKVVVLTHTLCHCSGKKW